MTIDEKDILKTEVIIPEAYSVGVLWNDPENYNFYKKEKLTQSHFGNDNYGFFLELGRYMNEKQVTVFDDISVAKCVTDLGEDYQKKYLKYGGYDVVAELMKETKDKNGNLEGYVSEIKKYHLLRELRVLYGDKVITNAGKYNYKNLNTNMIIKYWHDKLHKLSISIDSEIKSLNVLSGLRQLVVRADEKPNIGMPYYKSKFYSEVVNGWSRGTVTLTSAFSGNGKTSYIVNKLIMACIENRQKLVIIGNEMSCEDYQKLILLTIIGGELYEKFEKKGFDRKKINKGHFTDDERNKLIAAIEWIESFTTNEDLIVFVPMEDYNADNVERVMRYYANRNYFYFIIDTMKPSSSGGSDKSRWERFVEDSERFYAIGKKDGSGLNLAQHWNVQSADEALRLRFLDERCLADGRKIKNVVDVCEHFRPLWEDEYEGGKNALNIYKWTYDKFKDDGSYNKTIIGQPDPNYLYYAKFLSKSRKGQSNVTGLDAIIYKVDFNSNRWTEVGFAEIAKDKAY